MLLRDSSRNRIHLKVNQKEVKISIKDERKEKEKSKFKNENKKPQNITEKESIGKEPEGIKSENVFIESENNPYEDVLGIAFQEQDLKPIRSCRKCHAFRPPRAHHCSICNCCYLKMDHHCTLLNICIGFHNYKAFYLFLLANSLFSLGKCLIFFIELLRYGKSRNTTGSNGLDGLDVIPKPFYIVGISTSFVLGVVCLAMLFFHTFLIKNNETSIEYMGISGFLGGEYFSDRSFKEGPLSSEFKPTLVPETIETTEEGQNFNTPVNYDTTHYKLNNQRFRKKDIRKALNPYNLGVKQNFLEIFGLKWYKWPLPWSTGMGNGYSFTKNGLYRET